MNISELKKNIGLEGIPEVAGEVKKIFPIKKGEGQFGPWSFQDVLLGDNTGEIHASLRNRDEITDKFVGLPVLFQSEDGKGLKVVEEKYKNKKGEEVKTIKLAITGQAKLTWGAETPKDIPTPIKDLLDEKSLSMFKSYAKDLVVAGMNNGLYKDEVEAGAGFIHWLNLLTNKEEKKVEVEPIGEVLPF